MYLEVLLMENGWLNLSTLNLSPNFVEILRLLAFN